MATILLLIIFIDFIGLGVPDSLFGAAWPVIYTEFGLPVSMASCVTMLVSAGTVISALVSARLINRLGTAVVTAASTCLTALVLLGYSLSGNMLTLCLLALPLGLGAGAIDTALNNYVALHYKATHMNFLHCFYGVGVSVSPYIMALALGDNNQWRVGYRNAFYLQAAIALITILSLPLWKRAHPDSAVRNAQGEEVQVKTLSLRQLAGMSNVRAAWLVFFGSCAIEFTCGAWGATFLVNARGLTAADAAGTVTFFFVGMAVGRFLSGVLAKKVTPWQLICAGLCVVAGAILLLMLPIPGFVASLGLFCVGLGNGPLFPNMVHLTPRSFGAEISQSVMGTQMAASYVGIMLMPPLFGLLGQAVSMQLFPYFLLVMLVITFYSALRLMRATKAL